MNTMKDTSHTDIYHKLAKLIPDFKVLKPADTMKNLGRNGIMSLDLGVSKSARNYSVITLYHHYKNPDSNLITSSEMGIEIFHDRCFARIFIYADGSSIQCLYPDVPHVKPQDKEKYYTILDTWLSIFL